MDFSFFSIVETQEDPCIIEHPQCLWEVEVPVAPAGSLWQRPSRFSLLFPILAPRRKIRLREKPSISALLLNRRLHWACRPLLKWNLSSAERILTPKTR